MTRWFAIALTSISLSIFAINAVGIRPRDLAVRTWRNIGFLATTAACAVLMVTMTCMPSEQIQSPIGFRFRDWCYS